MYSLNVSELAHSDFDTIVKYIAIQLGNPTAATNLLDEVEKCYGNLQNNPFIYERCHDPRLEKEGYRKAIIRNYVLIYKINETDKTVTIYRFFYGAQDYIKQI